MMKKVYSNEMVVVESVKDLPIFKIKRENSKKYQNYEIARKAFIKMQGIATIAPIT